jgi:hypothetical protein
MTKNTNDPFFIQAMNAYRSNELLNWTIHHLSADPRNNELVEHIRKQPIVAVELKEYPLKLLKRIEGLPEAQPESSDIWNQRVSTIEEAIKNNTPLGPIIVTDFWNKLEIADGNHRHEALLKSGYKTYWTIFLLTHHDTLTYITEIHKNME